jgi:nitroimidazol reductase NimA-like FMN-containing flavoprotein (pyridoxamine 5'-phosphate oxidase superfamily)
MADAAIVRELEELSRRECLELLGTEQFGRIAVVLAGRPEIFPVNYALDSADCVVFRTSPGTKLAAAINHQVVFEVDHIQADRRSGWSVIVHGIAQPTTTVRPGTRPLDPWLHDKQQLVRITRRSISGRRLGTRD